MDATSTGTDGPRRLLIVDDERKSGEALARYFGLKGYEVRAVMSGEEALALAEVFHPTVVLLDLLMPGKDGIETLKEFKHLYPGIRVIMLSGADLDDVVQGALKLGADSYVVKPPDLPQLERLINGYWPSRKGGP
jgi:DNA-binding response OmpR family regulator